MSVKLAGQKELGGRIDLRPVEDRLKGVLEVFKHNGAGGLKVGPRCLYERRRGGDDFGPHSRRKP